MPIVVRVSDAGAAPAVACHQCQTTIDNDFGTVAWNPSGKTSLKQAYFVHDYCFDDFRRIHPVDLAATMPLREFLCALSEPPARSG